MSTTFFRKTIVFLIFLLYSEPYPMVWFIKTMQTIQVQNIKCGGCRNTITKALENLGATDIMVDITTGTIQYAYAGNLVDISDKLLSLGYPEVGSDKAGKILTKAQSYLSCAIGKLDS